MEETSAPDSNLTIPFSVLDLVPVLSGKGPSDSFKNSMDLARNCEKFGYSRYWIAEHHNMAGIASSATSILISHIAAGTNSIRVGSGGIMLPNHAPLIIAEQFGTLESLFPGRIDLGLGRAPGTDQLTAMALRRNLEGAGEDFAKSLMELRSYLSSDNSESAVRAIPGEGLDIPIWLLGSSTYSAQLAGILGLPFAFASHFAPAQLFSALQVYRESFRPSLSLKKPYAIACVNAIAAETDDEAEFQATSLFTAFLNVIRGKRTSLQAPVASMDMIWNEQERFAVMQMLKYTFIGSGAKMKSLLSEFVSKTGVNEIMINSHIFDHKTRVRSYEIISELVS
ncbi:MAG: LLM class flavin-dependent oxidoreductase [Daejeonella sp.]|uniref:LLM class flavin-dependent oxidoreductase n=1 Tax=Daejeonella sp. TaxID=2805397 RepID=UPI002736C577|nr:LLM class flavin-dependent oxidoreductase [Daejeonella sp.]MDP3469692.1 LLM class flavin-dependent oxidoreductase [Daejeonella sp.]